MYTHSLPSEEAKLLCLHGGVGAGEEGRTDPLTTLSPGL